MLRDNGKIRNCSSNWAKMTWYQYGWCFGLKDIYTLLRENYWYAIRKLGKGLFVLIVTTIILLPLLIIKPFLWHKKIIKAKKAGGK